MIRLTRTLPICAATLALLTAAAATAGTTVSRCEFHETGNYYVPGVRICSPTKITDIKMGDQGLTREIFYDDTALMNYAKARFDLSILDVAAGVCARCDGVRDEGDGRQETARSDAPVDTPTDEPSYDGPTDTVDSPGANTN